jgi:hypothetical protein
VATGIDVERRGGGDPAPMAWRRAKAVATSDVGNATRAYVPQYARLRWR